MSGRNFVVGHGRFDSYEDIRRRDTEDRRAFWDHVSRVSQKVDSRHFITPRKPTQPAALPESPLVELVRAARAYRDFVKALAQRYDPIPSIEIESEFVNRLSDLIVATDACNGIQLRTPR